MRFEKADAFWEAITDGVKLEERFGRVGAQIQRKTSKHATKTAAQVAARARAADRRAEGYREVTPADIQRKVKRYLAVSRRARA